MNPVFFHDPFWLTVVKILLLFVVLLVWTCLLYTSPSPRDS